MRIIKVSIIILGVTLLVSCGRPMQETTVQRKDITELVFASGILEPDNQYNLTAQTEGYLIELHIKEGDLVSKGEPLAVIDNSQNIINATSASDLYRIAQQNTLPGAPSLKQIEANLQAAEEKLEYDHLQSTRYKKLYEADCVSLLEYENKQLAVTSSRASLKALNEQYENQMQLNLQQEIQQRSTKDVSKVAKATNQLKAIISGKVYQLKKRLGDYVQKGNVIAVIGSPEDIYAKLNIDEGNMSKIRVGQHAAIQLNTNKKIIYRAKIGQILPAFDENSQSFIVKVFFNESLDFKISGTQLEANIITGAKKNALVVPRNYLGYGNNVLLEDGNVVNVKPGIVSTEWVEILDGLDEGQTIVNRKP